MLEMILISMVMQLVGMGVNMCFWAASAYMVMKWGRKGWNAGK